MILILFLFIFKGQTNGLPIVEMAYLVFIYVNGYETITFTLSY